MCGIAGGWWRTEPNNLKEKLEKAVNSLKHRGPNDSGYEIYPSNRGLIGFAHTRLSVIDLSAAGHQPMHSQDGLFSIIFNGEIYNYKEIRMKLKSLGYVFNSETDTEVIIQAWRHWGEKCVNRLIGMFSFTILDKLHNKLICVRDAFGIKPFYYSYDKNSFLFGSEISAIKVIGNSPLSLNWQRSYDYLLHGDYDSSEETFFSNVKCLMPGHLMEFDIKTSSLKSPIKWWNPNVSEDRSLKFNDAKENLKYLFLKNIKLHLRSDVRLGAALSGGIDSSAVVCSINNIEPDLSLDTFSYVAEGSRSEEKWVDIVNKKVHAIPHKVYFNHKEFVNDLDDMIFAQGEPFGGTSIYAQYRVFKLAKEIGISVTLDGQGADELLSGYNGYPGKRVRSLIDDGNIIEAAKFIIAWSRFPGRSLSRGLKQAMSEFVGGGKLYNFLRKVHGDPLQVSWLNSRVLKDKGIELVFPKVNENSVKSRRVVSELAYSLKEKGLPALLRHGDKNSMRFSIESRVPFLTTDLAEFLLRLPEDYLISMEGRTKSIFREAMRGVVPDEILDRKDKIGFETPEKNLLLAIAPQVRSWLSTDVGLPFLNQKKLIEEFDLIIQMGGDLTHQVWRWINFVRWYQLNFLVKD